MSKKKELDVASIVAPPNTRPRDDQSWFPSDADRWGNKAPVPMSRELQRILALPRRARELDGTQRAEDLVDLMTARLARKDGWEHRCKHIDPEARCIDRLRLVQAVALREIGIRGGLLGPIGVGHGKSLIDVLAATVLAESCGLTRILLLIPPNLASQLANEYRLIGQHFRVPKIVFQGRMTYSNASVVDPLVPLEKDAPLLQVLPYSLLSRPQWTSWLERVMVPEAIVADECHKLRNVRTATGARVDRYFDKYPKTKFVGMSGSITAKTIRDYDHMSRWALRETSPLPNDPNVTADWARALDPSDAPADAGCLMELCAPGEDVVSGFRRRCAETLGFVTTTAPPIDVELAISERAAPPLPDAVRLALNGDPSKEDPRGVRDGVRPDGEEFACAFDQAATARQVACGFYYYWIFPKHVFPRDTQLVEEWREARKEYNKEVRHKLQAGEEHLDSPLLCRHAAERALGMRPSNKNLPSWRSTTFTRYQAVEKLVHHDTAVQWISDYIVNDIIAWMSERPGIVWYEAAALGARVAKLTGAPMYGGGKDGGGLLFPDRDPRAGQIREDGSRSILLSIDAHGTGRNGLQRVFDRQLIPVLPGNNQAEQVLGRLHRIGQESKLVTAEFYRHTQELHDSVNTALRDALYVEGTLGSQQKLRLGFAIDLRRDEE